MSDHIAAVRAQAHIEAKRRYGFGELPVVRRIGFEYGADWLASRLTREKVAEALCAVMDDESFSGKPCAACLQGSDAILALLTEEDHASNT